MPTIEIHISGSGLITILIIAVLSVLWLVYTINTARITRKCFKHYGQIKNQPTNSAEQGKKP